jgi:hypothetical protein
MRVKKVRVEVLTEKEATELVKMNSFNPECPPATNIGEMSNNCFPVQSDDQRKRKVPRTSKVASEISITDGTPLIVEFPKLKLQLPKLADSRRKGQPATNHVTDKRNYIFVHCTINFNETDYHVRNGNTQFFPQNDVCMYN